MSRSPISRYHDTFRSAAAHSRTLPHSLPTKDKVLVANGQGFWGDSIIAPVRLVNEGPLDYLTLDYLAEVTMSIMQKLRARDPSKGYATDFVALIDRILPQLVEKDIRVIANAGGVNPHACKDAVLESSAIDIHCPFTAAVQSIVESLLLVIVIVFVITSPRMIRSISTILGAITNDGTKL